MKRLQALKSKLRNDHILGIILIVLGVISGWGIALFFFYVRQGVPISMLLAPAGLILIGLLMLLNDNLERMLQIQDEIQSFPSLVRDDFEALKRGRITPAHAMLVITIVTLVGQTTAFILFRKWEARFWGCANVIFVAVIAGFIVAFLGIGTSWFQNRRHRLSWWIFMIPLAALALSAFLGLYFAEPPLRSVRAVAANPSADIQVSSLSPRIYQERVFWGLDFIGDMMTFDCDEEICLVVILVAVAIACIIASAVIPNFWVVATTILWVIMFLIALREWLVVEVPQPKKT